MSPKRAIFISAVSKELRSARQLVANTLTFVGYEPIWQDIFGTETDDLREMLRQQMSPTTLASSRSPNSIARSSGSSANRRPSSEPISIRVPAKTNLPREGGAPFVDLGTSLLDPARVAIGTGKIGIFRIDMKEIMTLKVNLLEPFGVSLSQDEMAGAAVAGLDR